MLNRVCCTPTQNCQINLGQGVWNRPRHRPMLNNVEVGGVSSGRSGATSNIDITSRRSEAASEFANGESLSIVSINIREVTDGHLH